MWFRLEEIVCPFWPIRGHETYRFLNIRIPEEWRRSLDVAKQDGVRAVLEWRKSRQSRKILIFDGGRGGKGGASGSARLPLSTSGTDRKWRRARSAHNSAYCDTSCESSWLEQSIGIYINATRSWSDLLNSPLFQFIIFFIISDFWLIKIIFSVP